MRQSLHLVHIMIREVLNGLELVPPAIMRERVGGFSGKYVVKRMHENPFCQGRFSDPGWELYYFLLLSFFTKASNSRNSGPTGPEPPPILGALSPLKVEPLSTL